jgi:hypothetical protein
MEQHIKTARDVHLARARVGVERVDDAEEGTESAVGDTGFGGEVREVGDGGTGGLCGKRESALAIIATSTRFFPMRKQRRKGEDRKLLTHLTTRSRSSRNRNERPQRLFDRKTLANGSIDEVVEVGVFVDGEEVGDLGSVWRRGRGG